MSVCVIIGVMKRHYPALCNSLPTNAQNSILKLRQYNKMLPQEAVEAIASCSSVNERMVTCFIVSCTGDEEFFWFCDQMEKLVENPHCVEALRNGLSKVKIRLILYISVATSSFTYT